MEPNAVPHDSIIVDAQSALDILPKSGVAFACAYGSRYLEDAKKSQLDLLVVVDNAHLNEWHYENLHRNPKHYFLSSMPPVAYQLATRLQRMPPGVFFHTFVDHPLYEEKVKQGLPKEEIGSPFWKYGVVGVADLIDDLTSWKHLFIAGRMHKPILELNVDALATTKNEIYQARRTNLKAALAAALVILPQNFSELDLYYTVSGLSYAGDIRLMVGAENPNKLVNMVYNQPQAAQRFRELFEETIDGLLTRGLLYRSQKTTTASSPNGVPIYKFEQNPDMKPELVRTYLPTTAQDYLYRSSSGVADLSKQMQKYVTSTVRRSSAKQLVNNMLMNNPAKSAKYAVAKLLKGLRR